jgi:hypothetical protein
VGPNPSRSSDLQARWQTPVPFLSQTAVPAAVPVRVEGLSHPHLQSHTISSLRRTCNLSSPRRPVEDGRATLTPLLLYTFNSRLPHRHHRFPLPAPSRLRNRLRRTEVYFHSRRRRFPSINSILLVLEKAEKDQGWLEGRASCGIRKICVEASSHRPRTLTSVRIRLIE